MSDKELLMGLIRLSDRDTSRGWRVTLDYDNVQDGARVLDAYGNVLGECYDIEKEPDQQFVAAIEAAINYVNALP